MGQLGLVLLHLLLGAAAFLHFHAQPPVGLGQLGRAPLDALLQFLVGLAQLLFGLDQSLGLTRPLQRLVDDRRQQLHERSALDEVIVGAAFHHFHGHALAAVPGGHHERHPPSLGLELFDELLAAHVGQAVVQQHEAGRILLQPGQGRGAVGHAHRAMAAGRQLFLDQLQQRGVVLDNRRQQFHEHRALDEIIVGAAFHHFHGHAFAAVARGHHERHALPLGLDARKLLAAHVGQAIIQEDQAGRILFQPRQGRRAVRHAHRSVAAGGQTFFDQLQQGGVVFDDEDQLRRLVLRRRDSPRLAVLLAGNRHVAFFRSPRFVPSQEGGVRLAGFEPATYGLGNRCSIP